MLRCHTETAHIIRQSVLALSRAGKAAARAARFAAAAFQRLAWLHVIPRPQLDINTRILLCPEKLAAAESAVTVCAA